MAGNFTRRMYDNCAFTQDTMQSTGQLDFSLDVTKFVNCGNLCRPDRTYLPGTALRVDVESSLWGIDKIASDCSRAKHPFCGPSGCMLTSDPRVPPHITPYACERGGSGDNTVIQTNMRMPTGPGFTVPDPTACNAQGNGYYVIH